MVGEGLVHLGFIIEAREVRAKDERTKTSMSSRGCDFNASHLPPIRLNLSFHPKGARMFIVQVKDPLLE
jgi:hypothetical protein